MNKKVSTFLTTLMVMAGISAQTALEISQKASDAIEYESMEMTSTLKIYDAKGSERIRQITMATKKFGETNKTMIKFISPADVKGTAMLIYDYKNKDDDMWIYMPALRKTRRIVSSEKGKSFMGSEFTNADMSKPNMDNFDYKILSIETFEGKECWKIETTCKTKDIEDENGYSKKIFWIEKSNFISHKIEFYNREGEVFKVQLLQQYKKQANGKYFSFYMEMKNLKNGRKSVMTIDKFQDNTSLPESTFTPAMLEK